MSQKKYLDLGGLRVFKDELDEYFIKQSGVLLKVRDTENREKAYTGRDLPIDLINGVYYATTSKTATRVSNPLTIKTLDGDIEWNGSDKATIDLLIKQYRLEYTATESLVDIQPCNIIEYSKHEYNNETGKGVFIYNEAFTSIGNSVFEGCSSLKSIIIPDSVTLIGNSVFEGCSSLKSIIIPDSVTSIGNSAFEGCSSLKSIIIPDSVTSIGNSAFEGCSSLINIYCKPITPPIIQSNTLYSGIGTIYVPNKSLDAYKYASNWSGYVNKMVGSEILSLLDDSLTGISISLEERIKYLEKCYKELVQRIEVLEGYHNDSSFDDSSNSYSDSSFDDSSNSYSDSSFDDSSNSYSDDSFDDSSNSYSDDSFDDSSNSYSDSSFDDNDGDGDNDGTCADNYGSCGDNYGTCADDYGSCGDNDGTCADNYGSCGDNDGTCTDSDNGTCGSTV